MKSNYMPEMRFPEFTLNWKKSILKNILKINSGRDHKHLQQGNIPVYGTGGYMFSVNDKLSEENAIGIGRKGTINKPQLLKAPFWTVDTLFFMTTKEKKDLYFCYTLAKKINWKKYDESTGVPSLSKKNIEKIPVTIPELEEQTKIGNYFKKLDDIIALQQQELDNLKETKQGFLQKMLPKEGESVPEIRFPRFIGEWRQVKLGDISESLEYGLNASATEYDGENKYIRITDIDDVNHKFITNNLTSPNTVLLSAESYLLEEGDILFARTGASVGKSYIYDKRDGKTYYAGFLIRARIKSTYSPEFIFQNTLTSKYEKFIAINSQRSGQPGVNAKEYSRFLIMIPNINEQIKIGNFFNHFDDAIALHQQELEALQETKKAFLQKMFV